MKQLPGVLLFLVLALVVLEIVTLRTLSSTQKRLTILETKVEALAATPKTASTNNPPAETK